MTARGTDWGLAALVACLVATGVLTLFDGSSHDGWVFAAHDALGVAIALLVIVKLRRVWTRVASAQKWDGRTAAGAAAVALVSATLASGWLWSAGGDLDIAGYSLLGWHDALGAVLAVIVGIHMAARAKPLRARDVTHRRQFLIAAGAGAGSLLAWRAQRPVLALMHLRGARRRFTGSYEAGSFAGNAFPSTSWVADRPRPVALEGYRLRVTGLVARELELSLDELAPGDELVATLDCTGGFYSTQRWRGNLVARLLEQAGVQPRARHVTFVSLTGYRWSYALADALPLLLASHVGSEPLSHEHGAPLRLVAPGSRGFQWVKWVQRIELSEHPDYTAPGSTIWSSFTRVGRGDA